MGLTRVSIMRPIFILMVILAIVVLGWQSQQKMAVDLYPKIDIPFVAVATIYPGAGPEEIETLVSKPLEDAVSSINKVKNVTSASQEGVSTVSIEFDLSADLDAAAADVRDRVSAEKGQLPQDAEEPTIIKFDIAAMPVLYLGLSSKMPPAQLRRLVDDVVKDRLSQVAGVASVAVSGGDVREIQVAIDRDRLSAYGLSPLDVSQAIASENLNLPSGTVTQGRKEYAVRAMGEFKLVDEIRNLKIHARDAMGRLKVIPLASIATVMDTVAERKQYSRLNGQDSVAVVIQKQSDANTVSVVDDVQKELARIKSQKIVPEDVQISVAQDQSTFIKDSLHDLQRDLLLATFFATLVVLLFLHNIRGTIIVALAIPTSIFATFIPMHALGFTFNMMTLMALALCVGILVDDSIVVLENIWRHLHQGEDPKSAAVNGRSEIGLAAIAITLTDVVVFVPIAFMGGIVGRFFREFGLTIACATLFSLFVSFTLTPMLASRWFKRGEGGESQRGIWAVFDRFYGMLDSRYRRVLQWGLGHRFLTIFIGIGLLVLAMLPFKRLGFEFMPRSDQGNVNISIERPAGTSLAQTDQVVMKLEEYLAKYPEVTSIFSSLGTATAGMGAGNRGAQYAEIVVKLKDKLERKKSDQQVAESLRQFARNIPAAQVTVTNGGGMGGGGKPISIELTGSDMDKMVAYGRRLEQIVAKTPGTRDADISWKEGKPEYRAIIDRVKAAEMGFSAAQIGMAMRTSVEGDTSTEFREAGKEYDIRVMLREDSVTSEQDIANLIIGTVNGRTIRLRDVARVVPDFGPTKIDRKNRQRLITVSADLAGRPLGNVAQDIQAALQDAPAPTGVSLHFGGEAQDFAESMAEMVRALLLSVLLVYMLMAALFEAWLSPFIIMFSLPMALVGAILALVLTGESLSIMSMIGVIMLMGLVTKNAILLVDYTNTLRARGYERREAILTSGPTRLRPILMTTSAMILAMMPIAMKLGRGAEMRAPMAIAVIGGLLVSTMLTLLVIPVVYTLFDDLTAWFARVVLRRKPATQPVPSPTGGGD
ncbi:MAG: efflux RND transporter permease subunit [Armatimonadetes bacterium]|nr:efflux RND transporter permease subunit [Armatimonadota bacterium]